MNIFLNKNFQLDFIIYRWFWLPSVYLFLHLVKINKTIDNRLCFIFFLSFFRIQSVYLFPFFCFFCVNLLITQTRKLHLINGFSFDILCFVFYWDIDFNKNVFRWYFSNFNLIYLSLLEVFLFFCQYFVGVVFNSLSNRSTVIIFSFLSIS